MSEPQTRATDLAAVLAAAKARVAIDIRGIHGVRHWARVRENGHRLARHTGADRQVVELFAVLHDCCRENDRHDPGHGERAAEFAASLRGPLIHLPDDAFGLLYEAIRDHEKGLRRADVTVMTCWDADRLDLGRVRIRPLAKYLCTDVAQLRATIAWAYRRSRAG